MVKNDLKGLFFKLLFILALLLFFAGVIIFIKSENTVYYWDYAREWNFFKRSGLFLEQQGLLKFINYVIESVRQAQYNKLFVTPLLFFHKLFGPTRVSFVSAVTLVYGFGALASFGYFIYSFLSKSERKQLYLPLVLILSLFIPQFWLPIVRGYVGAGGLIFIFLIWSIHFRKTDSSDASYLKILLLVGLMLFRKYYVFWVISYLVTWFVESLVYLAYGKEKKLWLITKVLLVTIFTGGVYYLSTYPMLRSFFSTDYKSIYSAYFQAGSYGQAFGLILKYFGSYLVLTSILGLLYMYKSRKSRLALFILAQAVLAFYFFRKVQDFGVHHYYLLIPTISCFLAFFWIELVKRTFIKRRWLITIVLLLWIGNWWYTLKPFDQPGKSVFSNMIIEPLRNDLSGLERVVDYLEIMWEEDPGYIYVLASSDTINRDILVGFCYRKYSESEKRSLCDRFLYSKEIDSRDGSEVNLDSARYVVVADPIQYHLSPEHQKVVGIPAAMLLEGRGLGKYYQRLPQSFTLNKKTKAERDVSVYVYKRVESDSKKEIFNQNGVLSR